MKKNKLIIFFITMLVIIVTILNSNSKIFADSTSVSNVGNPIDSPGSFRPSANNSNSKVKEKADVILGIINGVGVIVSVCTLMVVGIKYMLGSIEEKAEFKETATMYLIGAFLVFGVTTLPNILYKFAQQI